MGLMRVAAPLWKRQDNEEDDRDDETLWPNDGAYDHDSWWWSDTGMAVRYALICVIFATIVLYFIGGYFHAQRRLKKGQPPLAYHRWMVARTVRYQQPQYQPHYRHGPDPYQEGYVMHGYAPPPNPPPAYHGDAPPAYAPPPEGASKAMADQNYHAPHRETDGEASTSLPAAPLPPRQ